MDTFDLEKKIKYTPKTLYMEYILINYYNFLKEKLEDKHITQGELTFLYNIYYHESISQRELADLLFVSEAYVTKILKKLEKKEYIKRKIDEKNKSKKMIYLSEKGRTLTSDFLKITHEWEKKLTKSLDYIEDDKLSKLLYDLAYNTIEK